MHGLTNYIDTKAKCRHLKNWRVKRLCGRCLSEFIDWRYIHSWLVFSTQHCELLPLYPSLWFNSPPSPLPCVNKNTVYTYTVCEGGIWGSGPQTDKKNLPQSPFTGQCCQMRSFYIAFYESYLSTHVTVEWLLGLIQYSLRRALIRLNIIIRGLFCGFYPQRFSIFWNIAYW